MPACAGMGQGLITRKRIEIELVGPYVCFLFKITLCCSLSLKIETKSLLTKVEFQVTE